MDKVNVKTRVNVNGLILGIDLGKYKSGVCAYEPAEPSWQLTSFTTNREVRRLRDYNHHCVLRHETPQRQN